MVSPFLPDDEKVDAIRALFPSLAAGIYLNAGSAGPLSTEVAAAMDETAARELAVGRGHPDLWPEALERMNEARGAVAAVLATDVEAIALTHSTTDGMNAAVGALPWQSGDRVITTRHEHPGGIGALLGFRASRGIEIDAVDLLGARDDDEVVARFAAAITPRTRAIVCSHVLWTDGTVLPMARIGALARDAGTACIVDAAQSAGAISLRPDELGVDAVALPAQKWLLGPEGMGALWVGSAARSWIPVAAGWQALASADLDAPRFQVDGRRFESTNYHRPSVVGFARACGWLAMYVGVAWATERGPRLARRLADTLATIPGVEVLTPRDRMGTLVTFRISGWPADTAMHALEERVFAIIRTIPPLGALRASVGFWATDAELERFAAAVGEVAAHDPESWPRRRLQVLGSDGRPIA